MWSLVNKHGSLKSYLDILGYNNKLTIRSCPTHAGADVSNIRNDSGMKMSYKNGSDLQKHWSVEIVQCINDEQLLVEMLILHWHEKCEIFHWQLTEWISETAIWWANDRVNQWTSDGTKHWINEWNNKSTNQWINKSMTRGSGEPMNQWTGEIISRWVDEFMNQPMKQQSTESTH